MKTRIRNILLDACFVGVLIATALTFTACGTPAQNVATAHFLAGNAFATYELGKSAAHLKGLQDLAKALPDIPSGKVSAFDMGVLNAELQAINQASVDPDLAKNSSALSQIGSLISAAVQSNASNSGGNPTITTAILTADLTDFANGITHGIEFWRGQQTVQNPTTSMAAPERAAFPAYVLR